MASEREGDDIAFVKEALASLATRPILVPALILAVLLAAGKLALLSFLPTPRDPDHLPYLLTFILIVFVTLAFVVAIMRILNRSARPPWQPDSSLWLYAAAFIASAFIFLLPICWSATGPIISADSPPLLWIRPFGPRSRPGWSRSRSSGRLHGGLGRG